MGRVVAGGLKGPEDPAFHSMAGRAQAQLPVKLNSVVNAARVRRGHPLQTPVQPHKVTAVGTVLALYRTGSEQKPYKRMSISARIEFVVHTWQQQNMGCAARR